MEKQGLTKEVRNGKDCQRQKSQPCTKTNRMRQGMKGDVRTCMQKTRKRDSSHSSTVEAERDYIK
jgi:hypothetical protein